MKITTWVKLSVLQWYDHLCAALLRKLLRFPLGLETFYAWCAGTITCPNEYCILDPTRKMILLFTRPGSDPFFGGQLHVSGTVLLPGENPAEVWTRLQQSDKYGLSGLAYPRPVQIGAIDTERGAQIDGKCPRGAERNMIFAVICPNPDMVRTGRWCALDELDDIDIIRHHRRYLKAVLIPWLER